MKQAPGISPSRGRAWVWVSLQPGHGPTKGLLLWHVHLLQGIISVHSQLLPLDKHWASWIDHLLLFHLFFLLFCSASLGIFSCF